MLVEQLGVPVAMVTGSERTQDHRGGRSRDARPSRGFKGAIGAQAVLNPLQVGFRAAALPGRGCRARLVLQLRMSLKIKEPPACLIA